MERPTQQFEIGGHRFVAKTYVTAREQQTIDQAVFKGQKVEMVGDKPTISELNVAGLNEPQYELIRQIVVSMDEDTSDILNRCLDQLPAADYDELIAKLDALVSKKKS